MRGFPEVKLSEVTQILSGFAFDSAMFSESGEYPLIRIRDVARGYSNTYYNGEFDDKYVIENGDLLISMDGEFKTSFWSGGSALLNQRVCRISPSDDRLDLRYLAYFLPPELKAIEDRTPFVTVKHLSAKDVRNIELFLPPIDEQRRIGGILDKADAIRRKRQQVLALTDEFLRSAFLEMFGNCFANAKEWPRKPLGTISTKFSDGPFGSNLKSEHYSGNGVRVIRLQNIGVNEFIDDDKAYVSEDHFAALSKHTCLPGDVIIGTLGDPNLRAFIQPTSLPIALNKADCVQFRPDLYQCTAEYVCAMLNQPSTLAAAAHLLHGQTRVRISMGTLRQLELPVPPLSMQQDFSAIYRRTERLKRVVLAAIEGENFLFASLSQRAFRGELRNPHSAECA